MLAERERERERDGPRRMNDNLYFYQLEVGRVTSTAVAEAVVSYRVLHFSNEKRKITANS